MRLVVKVAVAIAVDVALDIASAIFSAGAKVRIDRRGVLARIEIAVAGNFLDSGLRRCQAGLRRDLQRRVVAAVVAAALPRISMRD